MKQKLQTIASVSAASFLVFSALAQDATNLVTNGQNVTAYDMSGAKFQSRLKDTAEASHIIGMIDKKLPK